MNKVNPFLKAYSDLMDKGYRNSPRGHEVYELENYHMDLHPIDDRFTSFRARKFNLNYAKTELLWYLRGNRFDNEEITDSAAIWKDIIDVDGGINSNYGQYIFHDQAQYKWVVEELVRDKDSRRAVMVLLNNSHLRITNPDIVCTYSIGFRIRRNKLNMTIHMRSWDAIFGMTNDVFCFTIIYELIYNLLKWFYKDLEVGIYHHVADSFHVYKRHFNMIETIIDEGMSDYYVIKCPRIESANESAYLINHHTQLTPHPDHKFSQWLMKR